MVKIAWRSLTSCPSRHPDVKGHPCLLVRVNADPHFPIPWVFCLLVHHHGCFPYLQGSPAPYEKVQPDARSRFCVDIVPERGHQPGNVGRTTGRPKPLPAGIPPCGGQGITIEKVVSIEG